MHVVLLSNIPRILSVHIAGNIYLNRFHGSLIMNVWHIVKCRIILFVMLTFKLGDKKNAISYLDDAKYLITFCFTIRFTVSYAIILVRYYKRTVLTISRKRLAVPQKRLDFGFCLCCVISLLPANVLFFLSDNQISAENLNPLKSTSTNICRPDSHVHTCRVIGRFFSTDHSLYPTTDIRRLNESIVFRRSLGCWPSCSIDYSFSSLSVHGRGVQISVDNPSARSWYTYRTTWCSGVLHVNYERFQERRLQLRWQLDSARWRWKQIRRWRGAICNTSSCSRQSLHP